MQKKDEQCNEPNWWVSLSLYVTVVSSFILLLGACSAVGNKVSSSEPSIASLGSNKYSIAYYAKDLQEAGSKLEQLAKNTCKGRPYDLDEYKTDDWRPVYVAVQSRITCK